MKKQLFFLLLTLCSIVKADDIVLQIWQSDGQVMSINLTDEPKTTYVDGNLVITTTNTTITYPLEEVKKYTYMSTNGITQPEGLTARFSQDGESITFSGLERDTEISVYSSAGQIVRNVKANGKDKTTVSVSDLPTGVYVVKVNAITYKITKR